MNDAPLQSYSKLSNGDLLSHLDSRLFPSNSMSRARLGLPGGFKGPYIENLCFLHKKQSVLKTPLSSIDLKVIREVYTISLLDFCFPIA